MAYRDLQEFVRFLEERSLLKRITQEVDPVLEISEITDRVTKGGGPALLFENVKGSSMPLLINTFGTLDRMCHALEVASLDHVADRIARLLKPDLPTNLFEKLQALSKLKEFSSALPATVRSAPCQEVIHRDQPSLSQIPILQCWPKDGGRYITFPMVITKDLETGLRNVGCYRMQVFDDQTTAMHWQLHKDGTAHYQKYKKAGKRMEVAVALGADPATMYAATAPLPHGMDEFALAGFLRKKPVELVKCQTVNLEVPANAEIVLEGYVDPKELRTEGPFGDHTGFYSLADEFPVFHITCITHRRQPIYPTIIVGKPIQEDDFLGKATERIFLPFIRMMVPEMVDLHLPFEGVFHNCAIVSIRKSYPGQAKKVMQAIWGLGQLMFSKVIIVVEDSVNIQNLSEVAWRVLNSIDPKRDISFSEGPIDELDVSSCYAYYGTKMGIDATNKGPEEGMKRDWPDEIAMSQEIKALVDQRWKAYGFDGFSGTAH